MNGVSTINITEEITLITLSNIPCDQGLTASILCSFAQEGINIDMISQSAPLGNTVNVSFTVNGEDMVKTLRIINSFRETYPAARPMVNSSNCKIQLYGEEMRTTPGVAAAALQAAAQAAPGEIMLITTSEVDISLLVPHSHAQDVAQALKGEFSL